MYLSKTIIYWTISRLVFLIKEIIVFKHEWFLDMLGFLNTELFWPLLVPIFKIVLVLFLVQTYVSLRFLLPIQHNEIAQRKLKEKQQRLPPQTPSLLLLIIHSLHSFQYSCFSTKEIVSSLRENRWTACSLDYPVQLGHSIWKEPLNVIFWCEQHKWNSIQLYHTAAQQGSRRWISQNMGKCCKI